MSAEVIPIGRRRRATCGCARHELEALLGRLRTHPDPHHVLDDVEQTITRLLAAPQKGTPDV